MEDEACEALEDDHQPEEESSCYPDRRNEPVRLSACARMRLRCGARYRPGSPGEEPARQADQYHHQCDEWNETNLVGADPGNECIIRLGVDQPRGRARVDPGGRKAPFD